MNQGLAKLVYKFQDFPVLLGPTNTVKGRRSMLASAIDPKLEIVNSRDFVLVGNAVVMQRPSSSVVGCFHRDGGRCLGERVICPSFSCICNDVQS